MRNASTREIVAKNRWWKLLRGSAVVALVGIAIAQGVLSLLIHLGWWPY